MNFIRDVILILFSLSSIIYSQTTDSLTFWGDFVHQITISPIFSVEKDNDSLVTSHFVSPNNYFLGGYITVGRYNLYLSALGKLTYKNGFATNSRGTAVYGGYKYIKAISGIGFGFKLFDNLWYSPYFDLIPAQYFQSSNQYNSSDDFNDKQFKFALYTLYSFRFIIKKRYNLQIGLYKLFLPSSTYPGEIGVDVTFGIIKQKEN